MSQALSSRRGRLTNDIFAANIRSSKIFAVIAADAFLTRGPLVKKVAERA